MKYFQFSTPMVRFSPVVRYVFTHAINYSNLVREIIQIVHKPKRPASPHYGLALTKRLWLIEFLHCCRIGLQGDTSDPRTKSFLYILDLLPRWGLALTHRHPRPPPSLSPPTVSVWRFRFSCMRALPLTTDAVHPSAARFLSLWHCIVARWLCREHGLASQQGRIPMGSNVAFYIWRYLCPAEAHTELLWSQQWRAYKNNQILMRIIYISRTYTVKHHVFPIVCIIVLLLHLNNLGPLSRFSYSLANSLFFCCLLFPPTPL
jgi:hypothetical protein